MTVLWKKQKNNQISINNDKCYASENIWEGQLNWKTF